MGVGYDELRNDNDVINNNDDIKGKVGQKERAVVCGVMRSEVMVLLLLLLMMKSMTRNVKTKKKR